MASSVGYIQHGINLLQVGALRGPCLLANVAAIYKIGQVALRIISSTLSFFGFNPESTFSKWVTKAVEWVRPTEDANKSSRQYLIGADNSEVNKKEEVSTQRLIIEAIGLAIIANVGNTLVTFAFGPAPEAIYNPILQWVGPFRISADPHPLVSILQQRFYS